MVQQVTHKFQAQEPEFGWCVGLIQQVIGSAFDVQMVTFTGVLMLVMGLIGDVETLKDVLGLVQNFNLVLVADQFGWSTTIPDDVKKGVDECLLCFQAATVRHKPGENLREHEEP